MKLLTTFILVTMQWLNAMDSVIDLCWATGQEYRALELAKQKSERIRTELGENNEDYIKSLLVLSYIYDERDFPDKANACHQQVFEPYVVKLQTDFSTISENERTLYWKTAYQYFGKTLSLGYSNSRPYYRKHSDRVAAAVYDVLLLSKGILLNVSRNYEQFIVRTGDPDALQLLEERKSAQLYAPMEVDSIDYRILEALEKAGTPYEIKNLSVRWEQVRDALGKNDVAIEFFRTEKGDYAAVVLKADWNAPRLVRLSKPQKEGNPLFRLRKRKATIDEGNMSGIWPDALLRYFPKPDEGTVYFAADGILLQTGIEYLPIQSDYDLRNDSTYLTMADAYHIVRLSSTRELVLRHSENTIDSAVVYGGIEYNLSYDQFKNESSKYPLLARRGLEDSLNRGVVCDLPGTKIEADSIYKILHGNHIVTQMYTDASANEESFKSLKGEQSQILHVGTHGFAWTDSVARTRDYFLQRRENLSGRKDDLVLDPLNRCGLLLAGANTAYSGNSVELPSGVQDGVLTAKEISLMDLQGCNIVVLSACETAKGDITSEGVFGLQRAFKMAGVQTIIMSLWKVDDRATQLLMTEFYRNWIEFHQSKRDAFRNAQNAVRFYKDANGRYIYNNAYYWAGFVILDDL